MSADNWAHCPKCGTRDSLDINEGATFREDYWIGVIEDGVFFIEYRGHCTACKFTFVFNHEQNLKEMT